MNPSTTGTVTVSTTWAIAIFFGLIALVLALLVFKKTYVYLVHRKRFFIIPHVSVKGITNIAMVIAMAVSIIIIIMAVTGGLAGVFFRTYPGTRVTIEIILVKISGLLFGPIIGLVSGAAIDLLTVTLSAGFFHYGYFMAAMLTGLLSGSLRSVINAAKVSKYKNLFLMLALSAFMAGSTIICIVAFSLVPGLREAGFQLSFPGIATVSLSLDNFYVLLAAVNVLIVAAIWVIYALKIGYDRKHRTNLAALAYKKYRHGNHKNVFGLSMKKNWFEPLVTTVTLAASVGLLVNVLFLPIFDAQITGQPYTFWVLFRYIVLYFLFALDVIVIYPIMLIVGPIVKYNYEDELIESLNTPLNYDTWAFQELTAMSEKEIIECSKSLLFDLNDAQLEQLTQNFRQIVSSFERVSKIDTDGLEPCNYPIAVSAHALRDDDVVSAAGDPDIMRCPEMVENGLVKVH